MRHTEQGGGKIYAWTNQYEGSTNEMESYVQLGTASELIGVITDAYVAGEKRPAHVYFLQDGQLHEVTLNFAINYSDKDWIYYESDVTLKTDNNKKVDSLIIKIDGNA
jgi:hypothetical protein